MKDRTSTVLSGEPIVKNWDWWNDFLQREYYGGLEEREGWNAVSDAIARDTGLMPGMRVLDLGSGCGELAMEFSRRGALVTAIEASTRLVKHCASAAAAQGLHVEFLVADMFTWEPDTKFDVVLSVNTSFGYGERSENLTLIRRISQWLRPDGKLFLDVVSADHADSFGTWNDAVAGGRLIVDNEWNTESSTMFNYPTWISPDSQIYVAESPETVQIYTRRELENVMKESGLDPRRLRHPMARARAQTEEDMMTTWVAVRRNMSTLPRM